MTYTSHAACAPYCMRQWRFGFRNKTYNQKMIENKVKPFRKPTVVHVNELCCIYGGVTYEQNSGAHVADGAAVMHIWMSPVAHMDESRRTYEWVMLHIWMSPVAHMDESRRTYKWVMLHIRMSHVAHMNESCCTYEGPFILCLVGSLKLCLFCKGAL